MDGIAIIGQIFNVFVSCVGPYVHVRSLCQVHQFMWQEAATLWMMWQRGFIVQGYFWGDCASQGAALLQNSVNLEPAFPSRVPHARCIPSTDQNQADEGCKYIVVGVRQGSRDTAESHAV